MEFVTATASERGGAVNRPCASMLKNLSDREKLIRLAGLWW